MTATLFQMGFRSGGFQPLPMRLGFSAADITGLTTRISAYTKEAGDIVGLFQGKTPPPTTPIAPPPAQAQSTILGLPSSAVVIGGALLLGGGVLAAVLLSQK